jgi:hypothetical protein
VPPPPVVPPPVCAKDPIEKTNTERRKSRDGFMEHPVEKSIGFLPGGSID